MDDAVLQRLGAIERRLLAIEARLTPAATPPPPPPPEPADAPALEASAAPAAPPPFSTVAPAIPLDDGPPLRDAYHNKRLAEKMNRLENWQRTMPPPLPSRKTDFDLERAVGLRWAGWIGAVVLMIGAVLGVKYAYDRGWLGGMPDALRTVLIALAGVGLIGLGEFIYRRVHRLAATGPYAAGVGVLFLAVYAAQAWYGLLGPATSVVLLAGVTATGMLLAARAELVSIASLSIVYAIVCPFGMGASDRPRGELLAYLLAIQAMAVGLSAWRATPRWWVLRGLALATTTIGQLALLRPGSSTGHAADVVAIVFAIVSAAIYQFELIYTTLRRPGTSLATEATGVCYSLFVTAALAVELLAAAYPAHSRALDARILLLLAIVTFALARLRVLPKLAAIGRGFFVQSTLLAAVAVPIWLDGPAMLFAWIALAGGLAVVAMFNRDRFPAGAAAAVWGVAAFGAVGWAFSAAGAKDVWFAIAGYDTPAAVVVAAALALAGHVTATAVQRAWPAAPAELFGPSAALPIDIVAVVAFAAIIERHLPGAVATRIGLGYAILLWAASFVVPLSRLGFVAVGGLAVGVVKWAAIDVLVPRLSRDWAPGGPAFLNAQTFTGVAFAAVFVLVGATGWRRLLDRRGADRNAAERWWAALLLAAVVAVGFVASMGIDRALAAPGAAAPWHRATAVNLWLTVLWSGCAAAWAAAAGATTAGQAVRRDIARCARGLAYVLAVKFAMVDVLGEATSGRASDAPFVWNLRLVALASVAALVTWADRARGDLRRGEGTGLIVLGLLLVTGSKEIDRYAVRQTDSPPWIVRQVGWSIYWSALAGVSLVLGFVRRRRPLRIAALALLAVTLVKVTIVDLAGVDTGWRILSFLGLGGLLLLTSVLYGRFELNVKHEAEPAEAPV